MDYQYTFTYPRTPTTFLYVYPIQTSTAMTASDTMTSTIFPRQMRSSAAPVSPLSSAVYCHCFLRLGFQNQIRPNSAAMR